MLAGTRLGPYEVVALLGAGGMGEVYRARDTRLSRDVAIKVVHPRLASDPDRLSRFEKEARAAAQLDHPNILVVHDVGSHEGSPFIVSELLQGESLREKLGSPLPPKKAMDYAIQIAHGLAAAHEKGIVHRDIKPENVFVTKDGHVKILDFGVAKLLPSFEASAVDTETPTASATQPGTAVGTVAYMSPEQVRGQPVDARTDLFSLGVVLYEMLSGKRPFQRDTAAEIMTAILREEPPDLSETNRSIPAALENVVRHCLEKEPDGRFQSARDVVFALEALPEVSTSRPPAPMSPTGVWLHRHRKSLVGAALLLVVLVVAGVLVLRGRDRMPLGPSQIRSIAVLPLKNYSGDASQDFFADGMTDALIADLAQIRALKVISRTSAVLYKDSKKPIPEIAKELGVEGIVEGSVVRSGSRVRVTAQLIDARQDQHVWASNYEREMTDVLVLQGELVRAISDEIRVQLTPQESQRLASQRKVDPEAYEAVMKGRLLLEHGTTEKELRAAIDLFKWATERDAVYAPGWAGLAEATWSLAAAGFEFVPPASVRDEALSAAKKALDLDEQLPEAHNARAQIAIDGEWDPEAAEHHFKRAIELRPGYAAAHNWYGQLLFNYTSRLDEARGHLKIARELDPFSPWNDINGCAIFLFTAHPHLDRAIKECGQALARSPGNFIVRWTRGDAYLAAVKPDLAVADLEATIEPSGRNLNFLAHLGLAYGMAGRPEDARRILRELQGLSGSRYVSPYQFACVHLGLGEKGEACRDLERGLLERTPMLVVACTADPVLRLFRGEPCIDKLFARIYRAVKLPEGASRGVGSAPQ